MEKVTFGAALEALKNNKKICRSGWNGKGMWLKIMPGFDIYQNEQVAKTPMGQEVPELEVIEYLPYIMMKTADNKFVPWLASQTDVLAEDWIILN